MIQKIFFTSESGNVKNRSKYIRGALYRNGYSIFKQAPKEINNPNYIWFHGLSGDKKLSENFIEKNYYKSI